MLPHASARSFACLLIIVTAAGCATTQDATSPTTAPPSEPSREPTPTAEATATEAATPSAAAARTVEVTSPVAFSITVPGDWEEDDSISSSTTHQFRVGVDRWVVFTALGPDMVTGWVEELTSGATFAASEPEPVELDGAEGVMLDIRLNEGEEEAVLFQEATLGAWVVSPERPNRIWVVDAGGEPLLIVTDAPERAFEGWVTIVEEALATLEWRN